MIIPAANSGRKDQVRGGAGGNGETSEYNKVKVGQTATTTTTTMRNEPAELRRLRARPI